MNPDTPRSLGFRMPAEWEAQHAIWLSWPHNTITWPGDRLHAVEQSYVEWIRALHTHQAIHLLVGNRDREAAVRERLRREGVGPEAIRFFQIENQDAWIRDYGPTFVVNDRTREKAMVKWTFNAWGNKYNDLKPDDSVPHAMNQLLGIRMFEPGLVLEGGSIDVNGSGTVLTTRQCLLHKNRNPNLSQQQIESYLGEYLNVSTVLWLDEGIVGDDTDGHIDDIARFVDRSTVVCVVEEDPNDDNYAILRENVDRLKTMRNETGQQLRVVDLPTPGYVGDDEGRLPASYANFYIGNGTVVVPTFDHANDAKAVDVLQRCFPQHRVVGVPCREMVFGLGTLHCGSQQEPAV